MDPMRPKVPVGSCSRAYITRLAAGATPRASASPEPFPNTEMAMCVPCPLLLSAGDGSNPNCVMVAATLPVRSGWFWSSPVSAMAIISPEPSRVNVALLPTFWTPAMDHARALWTRCSDVGSVHSTRPSWARCWTRLAAEVASAVA